MSGVMFGGEWMPEPLDYLRDQSYRDPVDEWPTPAELAEMAELDEEQEARRAGDRLRPRLDG